MTTRERWIAHFAAMARGELQPDNNGFYHVAPLPKKLQGEGSREPTIQLVSPTEQALQQAKAEIEEQKAGPPGMKQWRAKSLKGMVYAEPKSVKRQGGGRVKESRKKSKQEPQDSLS
jgi:hypothetical protein